jgi:hypothetical protein
MEEFPEYKFGDISKEIAKRWKELDSDEKNKYQSHTPIVEKDDTDTKTPTNKKTKKSKKKINTEHPLMNKKIVELKQMCKDNKIKSTGNKADLVERLEKINISMEDEEEDDNTLEEEMNTMQVSPSFSVKSGSPFSYCSDSDDQVFGENDV